MNPDPSNSTIRVLDVATVNQIAAGEVIERPSSVVKELVENSIDSGATAIRIDITSSEGKITGIKVSDDGKGMTSSDAELAFTPHATSKITAINDLFSLHTLGFRGEALASIAAVAKVTLITKLKGSTLTAGTRVVIVGGDIKSKSEIGAPEGTSVLVEDLFFNTPARKKFQKSFATELSRIHGIVEGLCLSYPEISFRLFHNNRDQITTERNSRMVDTVTRMFGSEYTRNLLSINADNPYCKITGYISRPVLSRKDSDRIFVSVNGRYVSVPLIVNALREGFGTLLPHGRYPIAFLSLTIDTHLIDVNVHPTKREIRISKETEIAEMLREAVKNLLSLHNLVPDASLQQTVFPTPEVSNDTSKKSGSYSKESQTIDASSTPGLELSDLPSFVEPTHKGTQTTDHQLRQTESSSHIPIKNQTVPSLKVLGQMGGIYILAVTPDDELFIIDQHAAHERIFYEMVTRNMATKEVQELLVPVIVHCTPKDAAILSELIPILAENNVVIEHFGPGSFIVRTVPAFLGKISSNDVIDDLISDLIHNEPDRPVGDRERITRIIACRSAIKAGTVCTQEQSQRIIDQLRGTKIPFTCPHGRPTMIRVKKTKLDEMFGRI